MPDTSGTRICPSVCGSMVTFVLSSIINKLVCCSGNHVVARVWRKVEAAAWRSAPAGKGPGQTVSGERAGDAGICCKHMTTWLVHQ